MNVLDFIFVVLIAVFFLMSFFRGTLREGISVLGLAAGFVAAHWFHQSLANVIEPLMPDRQWAELVAYVGIIALGFLAGVFFSGMGDLYSHERPTMGSRIFAGLMGLIKGVALALAVYWVIEYHIPPLQDELYDSQVGEGLNRLFELLADFRII